MKFELCLIAYSYGGKYGMLLYTNNIVVKKYRRISDCLVYWLLQVLLLLSVIRNIVQLRQLNMFLDIVSILDIDILCFWHVEAVCCPYVISGFILRLAVFLKTAI